MPDDPTALAPRSRAHWPLWLGAVALAVLGLFATWQFVGEAPPRELRVATGPAGGGYAEGGEALAAALAEAEIEVRLVASAGTRDNLARLREGVADVAFVQGGVADERAGIVGIASLYHEPLWVFVRADWPAAPTLAGLAGARVQVGAEGSGTRPVALALLEANGTADGVTLLDDPPEAAVASLRAAECDALFLVTAPQAPYVKELFADTAVRPWPLERNVAYSRRFRFLQPELLAPGMIDLEANLPPVPVPLVAPTAALVARDDLHPALVPLLIEAARRRYAHGGLFGAEGEFPNPHNLDFPVARAAVRYFEHGPSFLYRLLPFQVAATFDRLKIMLLPLLTLLIPLLRLAPPAYRWRARSRIVRWYGVLRELEQRVRAQDDAAGREAILEQLTALDREIAEVRVPLGFAEELYNVRMHVRLVRRGLEARRPTGDPVH